MIHFKKASTSLVALAGLCALLAGCGGDGSLKAPSPSPASAAIAFTAFANGATVEAGQSIHVVLDVTHPDAFTRGIALVGERGLGATAIKTEAPYSYTLAVPASLAPGAYHLSAVGYGAQPEALAHEGITLQIRLPGNALLSLSPPPTPLVFEAIGEQLPIRVTGHTNGGTVALGEAPRLDYVSSRPAIAPVDDGGLVTARAPGTASIALQFNGQPGGRVAIRVLPPALLPDPARIDFGDQQVNNQSSAQTVTVTNQFDWPIKILALSSGKTFPVSSNCLGASPLAPHASCTINVQFKPAGKGEIHGAITIANSAVIAPTRILLTGTGT